MANNKRGRHRSGGLVTRIVKFKDKTGKEKLRKVTFARVRFNDASGKRKDRLRRANSRTHGREVVKEMLRELDDYGENALDHNQRTFNDLADHYLKHYLTEAEYVGDRKVSGLRSLATPLGFLETLKSHFGALRLHDISYGRIRKFRDARLKTATRGDKARHKRALTHKPKSPLVVTRAIASTNRELALLRRMFNVGLQEGWLRRHPMKSGDSLISLAD